MRWLHGMLILGILASASVGMAGYKGQTVRVKKAELLGKTKTPERPLGGAFISNVLRSTVGNSAVLFNFETTNKGDTQAINWRETFQQKGNPLNSGQVIVVDTVPFGPVPLEITDSNGKVISNFYEYVFNFDNNGKPKITSINDKLGIEVFPKNYLRIQPGEGSSKSTTWEEKGVLVP